MKKATSHKGESPDIAPEYDFSRGVRGKYARHYAQGSNVVVLEPDVAMFLPDRESVNRSLRALAEIIHMRRKRV
ncbi:MAG: hypothetical protein HYY24_20660 [Verrucomicrobia bacterium]|nr:hypothetical protein [Verrucomicrobiota bacterium]